MTRALYALSFLFLQLPMLTAQQQVGVGQWRQYLPFHRAIHVTQSADEVFFSSDGGVVAVSKEDQSAQFYTKVNRLTDAGNNVLGYHPGTETLIVTYRNGNIDLLGPEGTFNLPFIKTSNNIIGEREINHIFIDGDGAFLASSFGLSRLDMKAAEFDYTTLTGVEVFASARFQDQYYMATAEGIYRTEIDNFNPADFTNWEYLDMEEGFPPAYRATGLAEKAGALFLTIDQGFYRYDGTDLDLLYEAEEGLEPNFLTAEGEHLLLGLECVDGCLGEVLSFDAEGNFVDYPRSCVSRPFYAVEDEAGNVWFADQFRNFRISFARGGGCGGYTYESPRTDGSFRMLIQEDTLYVASGSIAAAQQYTFNQEGVYIFADNDWDFISPINRPELSELRDFVDVAVHPVTNKKYFAAYFEGLAEVDGDQITVYNEKNSSLSNAVGDTARTRCSALAFDAQNNLWICNHEAEEIIAILKDDGTWTNIRPPYSERGLMEVMIDPNNFKWFILARGKDPLFVLDSGPDVDDTSDDRYRSFNASNSELPNNDVLSVAADLNGDVWVGTTDGVVTFDCGGAVFEPSICQGSRRIVTIDGIPALLLETESVTAIAVDGANRKWFGTSNGVFVQSADGTEQLNHFTTDNSPLPSNIIQSLAIDQETGEVFIGTNEGIVSYLGEAVEGGVVNNAEITVFPNPVRPDYDGPIAIRGLARDANVKITDVHGNLVFETTALGGQAIWNGRDFNGRRANTGVYLVFSTAVRNPTNPDAAVAKILFVN